MKILLMGDSITDMNRAREDSEQPEVFGFGNGYAFLIASELYKKYPKQHTIINRGISGNKITDIYDRIKKDCLNISPDIVSILVGINDVWHQIVYKNGTSIQEFETTYRKYLTEIKNSNPHIKFMLLEPFVLKGVNTEEYMSDFLHLKNYVTIVKNLASEFGATFIPLQAKFDEMAIKHGADYYLYDGVHPAIAGAKLIADEWLKAFENLN